MRDRLLTGLLRVSALLSGLLVFLILLFLVRESMPALADVGPWRLVSDASWHPEADAAAGHFNLLPMVLGSLLAALGAMLIATPLGFFCALYCHDYAPARIASVFRAMVGLMAGIPSVVYGFWGLVKLVPLLLLLSPPGASLLAGSLVLALMILPTVTLLCDGALAAVPQEHRRAAAALALSRWCTTVCVVVPAARSGILTAVLLACGRALGETMAVLMVCGNIVQVPGSVLDPIRTLTANIALEMAYALGDHRSSLFAGGLVLGVLVLLMVMAAERVRARYA